MNRTFIVCTLIVAGAFGCNRSSSTPAAPAPTPAAAAPAAAAPAAAAPAAAAPAAAAAAAAGAAHAPAGALTVGATQQGTLATGDTVLADEPGRLSDDYQITLTAGSPITIVTRGGPSTQNAGQTLDVVTSLICGGTQVARDDDGAGYPNSRIVYTPTATGTCTVRVMGFAGDQGAYTVQTYAGALENQT